MKYTTFNVIFYNRVIVNNKKILCIFTVNDKI